jgi:cytochrome c551/c552
MSILYMKLSDVNDSEELVGYAYQCMAQAYKTDSTATADFINTLPVDDMSQASAVKTIIGASGMMSFHDDGELLDSLFNNTEEQPKQ